MAGKYIFRWSVAGLVIAGTAMLFFIGMSRLRFETNIMDALPQSDPVLADARYILQHHPMLERVVIDVGLERPDPALLTECAKRAEAELVKSRLFKQVGLDRMQSLMPGLIAYSVANLPVLFSQAELEAAVAPLLTAEKIRENLAATLSGLGGLEGIGQAELIARDPLGLRNLVLARLRFLAPVQDARFENGLLVSADGRHCLLLAEPASAGTDTEFARRITSCIAATAASLDRQFGSSNRITLTPIGSYRAALDNEENAKRNVKNAVLFSTVAVALLLLGAFPRPLIGLLALLPACAGTMLAFFVYSLFHRSVTLLAVGFGGAIVSFTVDYGIAYLLFLDRPRETRGLEASRQVWSLGLLAMLTTAVGFAALSLSGFPALAEIGQFSALGVVFTYIFVHAVFPFIFKIMPAAAHEPYLPLQAAVNRLASSRPAGKAAVAFAFAGLMLFFARPDFHSDLSSLNAVTRETLAAEQLIKEVWGDISGSVQLIIEAGSREELRERADRLSTLLQQETIRGGLRAGLLPSAIMPGSEAARKHAAAWQRFWSPARAAATERALADASGALGFSADAFAPFVAMLRSSDAVCGDMPEEVSKIFGVGPYAEKKIWQQVLTLKPGPYYDRENFYRQIASHAGARMFDATLFSDRFAGVLLSAFLRMCIIVGIVTVMVAFLYFVDWQLTLLALAPTVFALICTLGTLNIMGQPLGIPVLMVTVVVIGMGTDYALYLIRAWQRYGDEQDSSMGLIRLSVFLSFATTLLGFGVLAVCDNPMLKSAGLGLALGIGYSFIGAVTIVPPVLRKMFAPVQALHKTLEPGSRRHLQRVLLHYRHMEAYPRLFARFKILLDPMFPKLADFLCAPRIIIDIGTGYGVPAAWLLELFPEAHVFGIEPDADRAHTAARVFGKRGRVQAGRAPDMPDIPEPADCALMLDMLHYLDDAEARETLIRLGEKLLPGAALIVRVTIPSHERAPVQRFIETTRLKVLGIVSFFRTAQQVRQLISGAGFSITGEELAAPGREEIWFIAQKM